MRLKFKFEFDVLFYQKKVNKPKHSVNKNLHKSNYEL